MANTFVVILAGDRAATGEELARVTARDVAGAAFKAIALCVREEFRLKAVVEIRDRNAAFVMFRDGTCLLILAPELAARVIEPAAIRFALEALPTHDPHHTEAR